MTAVRPAGPGPLERTRDSIIAVEAEADFQRRLERRGTVPLRRRGWRGDRLAVRTPTYAPDGATNEQAGATATE